MFRSDDEFEDGPQIEPFYGDSRKVVNVSRSRVGSGASRGARPLPWLGCLACKHLTWIFRSLVSPVSAVSPACRVEPGRAEHNHFFVLSPRSVCRLAVARLCLSRLASARSRFPSVKISPEASTERELGAGPGPEPSPEDQDQDGSVSVAADPSS